MKIWEKSQNNQIISSNSWDESKFGFAKSINFEVSGNAEIKSWDKFQISEIVKSKFYDRKSQNSLDRKSKFWNLWLSIFFKFWNKKLKWDKKLKFLQY